MGPLVPYIIPDEFSLVIAFFIGIAFGFILEQAGFSSTQKLVGLFYGYDFTVLRVFFTAGITAMIGVLIFIHYGILDYELIYINPTFLRSAIIGGAIMGAGFIIGGFCPGTSICAAAIGKMDAMLFIIGSLFGVLVFIEGYPIIKDVYLADALGPVKIYEKLGMSMTLFAFCMTAVALLAFYFTWLIEKRTRKISVKTPRKWFIRYSIAALIPFVFIAVVAFMPGKKEIIQNKITDAKKQQKCVFREIDADKLAYEIVNHYYQIHVIDVRTPEEYEKYHIPMSINIPLNEITNRKWEKIFKQKMKTNIFCADNDTVVRMACLKAKFVGKSDNYILRESISEFEAMFFKAEKPSYNASKQAINEYNFRIKAAADIINLNNALKNIGKPVQKEIKIAKGGCS